jgi:hypothetical protein
MLDLAKNILDSTKRIEDDLREIGNIPEEGNLPRSQQVIPFSVVRGSRGYIEKLVHQINGTYENGWFDSCSVMMRRLLETLIVEVYEKHGISQNIKNSSGEFYYLSDLISRTLSEQTWNLSRNTQKSLPKIKDIGDKSAHSRRFNAHKRDIDKHLSDIRVVVQEFVYLTGFK